jgi:protoporphyrinogen oxidase
MISTMSIPTVDILGVTPKGILHLSTSSDISKMGDIVVLGAGITGLSLAKELSDTYCNRVVVIEKNDHAGGLAATLSKNGLRFDLGSHRVHANTDKSIIGYVEYIIGEKLLIRPRRGRFYHFGGFITYPPNVISLFREFTTRDILLFGISFITSSVHLAKNAGENFEEVMITRVGKKAYDSFYHDYAFKLWGRDPRQISPDVGRRSRFLGGIQAFTRILLRDKSIFYYPPRGIGQISKKLVEKIEKNRGRILLGSKVVKLHAEKNNVVGVEFEGRNGKREMIKPSLVVSTIPIDDVYSMTFRDTSRQKLDWRGVRILYLLLEGRINKEPETYYFPNLDVVFGRVSQIAKYSPQMNNSIDTTLLTVEVPSSPGEKTWDVSESELVELCVADLIKTGILDHKPSIKKHFSIKLEKAYPVYTIGWKVKFSKMHSHLMGLDNVFLLGRCGLFLHCNIDHNISQARALADFIKKNWCFNKDSWVAASTGFRKAYARD